MQCQFLFCHLALRFNDHIKPFGHGISKGGKVGRVQGYPKFFQLLLHFIGTAWLRLLNLIFLKKLQAFSIGLRSGELSGDSETRMLWLLINFAAIFDL